MTDTDNAMNPHFGSDLADIRIRIRIDPEIWIRIPDYLWLRLDPLAEVCALRGGLVAKVFEKKSKVTFYLSVVGVSLT